MTAQFRLVSDIILDVRYRADIQGQLDRHPDAALLRLFNESAQQCRLRLTNLGFEWFLKDVQPGNLVTTPPIPTETYTEQDWPKDAARIYGVHVYFQTGLWLPLQPITLGGIRDFQQTRANVGVLGYPGAPRCFALKEAPYGVTSVETVGKIIIVPRPLVALPYKLFYLQNWADALSTDTFNGHTGFIEWIIWDMVIKVSARDNDSNQTYAIAGRERASVENILAAEAPKTQQAGADVPRRVEGIDSFIDEWRMIP